MRMLREQPAMTMASAFVVLAALLALVQPGQTGILASGMVAVGILTLAMAAAVAVRLGSRAVRPRVVVVGERAREHREALSEIAAPRHPSTAGRTRSRAPSKGNRAT